MAKMTFEEAAALLRYEDGALYWTVNRHAAAKAGDRVGFIQKRSGYFRFQCRRRSLAVHHVVWLLCKGEWPQITLDHINGDKLDNRIENLRPCTSAQNAQNRAPASGRRYKGVTRHKGGRYQVVVANQYVGLYDTEEEGARAYDAEALSRYGAFARLNFPSGAVS